MLVLFETAAGFAVFKVLNEKKVQECDNLFKEFQTPESASKIVMLEKFRKFKDVPTALSAATAMVEGQLSDPLKKLLKKVVAKHAHEELAVADAKLGGLIKEKFDLKCVTSANINELMRCIRSQLPSFIGNKELTQATLGLAHSLSRYKVKFSPDKVDTMIVQAISTLDDVDKEINNYHMRAKEWYSWHFPELARLVTDHEAFIRTVMMLGHKENASDCDLSDILPEEVEADVKDAATISMGTEISEEDIAIIVQLCKEIVKLVQYRANLSEYLKQRMATIAPNLTVLVGELVGARLISHAGSLVNLAKHPASTVQILGAEKALFRALKSKHDTPKYGLIYHASLVGQTAPKNKGKMSRMLAAKSSLAARVDALGDDTTTDTELGLKQRVKLEKRICELDNKAAHRLSGRGKEMRGPQRYENVSQVRTYNTAADSTLPSVQKRKLEDPDESGDAPPKKVKKDSAATPVKQEPLSDGEQATPDPEKKKKKKKKKDKKEEEAATPAKMEAGDAVSEGMSDASSEKKKKKKKKKSKGGDSD